ncbi:MAG: hypothetical protein H7834_16800, partial [Magnetococcus sp. YQC-9]
FVRTLIWLLLMVLALEMTHLLPVKKGKKAVGYNRHFTLKANDPRRFDMILYGHSTANTDLDPDSMATALPDMRIFNFSFPGVSMNPVMFAALERMLDPHSVRKMILLAFTPDNLRAAESINEIYYYPYKNVSWLDLQLYRLNLYELFTPTSPEQLHKAWVERNRKKESTTPPAKWIWHNDTGWLEVETQRSAGNHFSSHDYVKKYREFVNDLRVSTPVMERLFEQIRQWRTQGIRVFGHRSPLPPALERIADEVSQFDEKGFVREFERAGGVWIEVDSNHYATWDGYHLRSEDARKLSGYLAEVIRGQGL